MIEDKELPEGAVEMVRFELVVYMNEDGTQKYIWAQRGSMTTSNLIGFLEEVKFDILLAKEQQQ